MQYSMSSSTYQQGAAYLGRPQEAPFVSARETVRTPGFPFQIDTNPQSPPPLKTPPKNHPQAPDYDENLDILLPLIPDNYDDEELFSSKGEGEVKRSIALPIRPKMSAVPFFGHKICCIENSPLVSQRILLPLHASDDKRPISLPMKRSCLGE